MPITRDGVELTVEITEKAAEKIRYFAEKEGEPTTTSEFASPLRAAGAPA